MEEVEWFEELKGDFSDEKAMVERMMGAWILELPELSSIRKSEIEEIKAFIAAKHSTVRLSYDRRAEVFLRQCVFMGSTNEHEYLVDTTGNRRWWPVYCNTTHIDTDRLKSERDQLWAEAKHRYDEMRAEQPSGELPLYLTDPESHRLAMDYQESRRQVTDMDITAGVIADWLDKLVSIADLEGDDQCFTDLDEHIKVQREETCLLQIWQRCLGEQGRPKRSDSHMLGKAMRHIGGWEPSKKSERFGKYGMQKIWRRVKTQPS
jgi:hypothetical protein